MCVKNKNNNQQLIIIYNLHVLLIIFNKEFVLIKIIQIMKILNIFSLLLLIMEIVEILMKIFLIILEKLEEEIVDVFKQTLNKRIILMTNFILVVIKSRSY